MKRSVWSKVLSILLACTLVTGLSPMSAYAIGEVISGMNLQAGDPVDLGQDGNGDTPNDGDNQLQGSDDPDEGDNETISMADVELIAPDLNKFEYAVGDLGELGITLSYNGTELFSGMDYEYSYYEGHIVDPNDLDDTAALNPTSLEPGNYTLAFFGSNMYEGVKLYQFTIVPKDITNCPLVGFFDRGYTGDELEFSNAYLDIDGDMFGVSADSEYFTLAYGIDRQPEDGVEELEPVDAICEPGAYEVTFSANSDLYTGAAKATFRVYEDKEDIVDADVVLDTKEQTFELSSENQQFPVVITVSAFERDSDEIRELNGSGDEQEYEVLYVKDLNDLTDCRPLTEEGLYYVVVRGVGNWIGYKSSPFYIVDYENFDNYSIHFLNSNPTVSLAAEQVVYPEFSLIGYFNGENRTLPEDAYSVEVLQYNPETGNYDAAVEQQEQGFDYCLKLTPAKPYHGDEKSAKFQVVGPNDLAGAAINIEKLYPAADGSAVQPSYTVQIGDNLLEEDVDYTAVWYDENDEVVPGPSDVNVYYQLRITGLGDYAGSSQTVSYNLEQLIDLEIARDNGNLVVNGIMDEYPYTGEPIEFNPTLIYNGEELVSGQDYDIQFYYHDSPFIDDATLLDLNGLPPTEIDYYYVVISGKGRFEGAIIYDFAINIPFNSHNLSFFQDVYPTEGFIMAGSMPENFGFVVHPVDEEGYSIEDRTLTEDDYRVLGYKELIDEDAWTFGDLIPAADFDWSIPGKYCGVLEGTGDESDGYFGEVESSLFEICSPNNLLLASFGLNTTTYLYDKDNPKPVELDFYAFTAAGDKLTPGENCELVYVDCDSDGDFDEESATTDAPTDPGDYAVTVRGDGDTTFGQIDCWYGFSIVRSNDLKLAKITLKNSQNENDELFVHGADETIMPEFELTLNGKTLVENTDYTTKYIYYTNDGPVGPPMDGPLASGDYYAEFTSLSSSEKCVGTTESMTFHVVNAFSLNNAEFDLSRETYAYTENPVSLVLTDVVSPDGTPLIADTNYQLEYSKWLDDDDYNYGDAGDEGDGDESDYERVWTTTAPTDKGRYDVRLAGLGDYAGTYSEEHTFSIVDPMSLALATIIVEPESYAYKNETIEPSYTVSFDDGINEPKTLTPGVDYTVEYYEAIDAGYYGDPLSPKDEGSYVATIRPAEGSSYNMDDVDEYNEPRAWFNIVENHDLDNGCIDEVMQYEYAFTGEPIVVEPRVYSGIGELLIAGTHYTYEYRHYLTSDDEGPFEPISADQIVNLGYYAVRAVAKEGGGYEGATGWNVFRIVVQATTPTTSLEGASVQVAEGDYVYTGQEHRPDVTVTLDGAEIPEDGYEVSYEDNVDAGTATVTVTGTGDYSGTATAQFQIAKAEAIVTAIGNTKTYGTTDPELTADVRGTVNGDSIAYTVTRATGESVGTYAITAAGDAEQGNYHVTFNGASFTITPAQVTVTAQDVTRRIGESNPDFTATVEGLVGTDTVDYELSCTADENSPAGTYPITVSGAANQGNYTVAFVNGTLTVKQATTPTTSLEGASVQVATGNYVYTGQEHRPNVTVTLDGVEIPEDGYNVSYADNVDAGTATVTVTGTDDYSGTATGQFQIAKAEAIVTARGNTKAYGAADPELTVDIQGAVNGDAIAYAVTRAAGENVGTYAITVDGETEQANYHVAFVNGASFTITPAQVTVTARGNTKAYGAADPALTADVQGTVNGDSIAYTVTRAAGEDVGTYAITASGEASQGNYVVSYKPGVFTITKAASAIKLEDQAKTYTGGALAYSGKVTKSGSSGNVSFAYYSDEACTKAVAAANVKGAGTYYVKATLAADANYASATSGAAKYVIAKAKSSVSLATQSKTFTGGALAYSGKVTKSGSTGKVSFTYYSNAACTKAVAASNVKGAGTYYVKATLAADANHTSATSVAAKFVVGKAANPFALAKATRNVSASKVAKSKKVVAGAKVSKAGQGTVTYSIAKVNKKPFKKYVSINKKNGKITVKKGCPKGTFKVTVKAAAAGNANYNKSTAKTAVVTIKVK